MKFLLRFLSSLSLFALVFAAGCASQTPLEKDTAALRGPWKLVKAESSGERDSLPEVVDIRLTFKGNQMVLSSGEGFSSDPYTIDPEKTPKQLDITEKGITVMSTIYRIEGDALTICSRRGKIRPTEFKTTKEGGEDLAVFERVKE
jgi:uncharacterized protein (TIGR03067 family)